MTALPSSQAITGWKARLELGFVATSAGTRLAKRRHVGPLVVQKPFYPEGEVCHVYLVHPPGGVAGGDQLQLDVEVMPGAHALITTPAATKFYKSAGRLATQTQVLNLRAGNLEWLPQENIFFADAAVQLETRVKLESSARFIGWEMACYGRPAVQESLGRGKLLQNFELWKDGRPLLLDRLQLDGMGEMMRAPWGLAGHAVLGTLLAYPACEDDALDLRALQIEGGLLSSTCVDGVLVCRGVGAQAEALKKAFIQVWQHLRPRILNRDAMLPRIWAT